MSRLATERFRGKWDVPHYRRTIRGATAQDLPVLLEALRLERALHRPRKGLVKALRSRIVLLNPEGEL